VLYNNIDDLLSIDGDIVLVPHVITPPPDAAAFYRSGNANGDVVLFRKTSLPIIDWLLTQPMINNPGRGMFFEQTLLSSLPFIFENVAVCKDPSINYAYYNFYERKLEKNGDVFFVNGKPLALCQFSGYLDGEPDKISKYYRGGVPAESVLALFRQYEQNISAHKTSEQRILERMRKIEGWFEEEEAGLMMLAAQYLIASSPPPHICVEVGSYCGRSTVVLGSILNHLSQNGKLYAIDPHDGRNTSVSGAFRKLKPTLSRFQHNIEENGLGRIVHLKKQLSYEVNLNESIGILFIDGLHDYQNVARDFTHFRDKVIQGGLVLFHDYAENCPGVKRFVDELLGTRKYAKVKYAKTLILLKKLF
ncbi:MAG: class I SAM-dependent methyltransferase, partial [Limisphaerales bacterium]